MMRRGLLALPLLLAGCGGSEPETANNSVVILGNADELIVPVPESGANVANVAQAVAATVALAPDGLVIDDKPARFGMPRAAVTAMLAGAIGDPVEQGDYQECGSGALGFASFRDGLGIYFQDGKFAGWDLDGNDSGPLATAKGMRIGTTREQLEAATPATIVESTLGIEFSAGGLSGLLSARDPGGQVTNLWAGMTCIAR